MMLQSQVNVPTFSERNFENWELSFEAAARAKTNLLVLSSGKAEADIKTAIDSILWSELLMSVAGDKEALRVLHGLTKDKHTAEHGMVALRTRYQRSDAERRDLAMTRLESFAFGVGETLFGGLERFKGLRERTDKLEVALPNFRVTKILLTALAKFDAVLYTTLAFSIPDGDINKLLATLEAGAKSDLPAANLTTGIKAEEMVEYDGKQSAAAAPTHRRVAAPTTRGSNCELNTDDASDAVDHICGLVVQSDIKCEKCGKTGHLGKVCCSRGGFGGTHTPAGGHQNVFGTASTAVGCSAPPEEKPSDVFINYFAATATITESAGQAHHGTCIPRVIGDTGCSKNLVGLNYRPYMTNVCLKHCTFKLADGSSLSSTEEGLLTFVFPNGETRPLRCSISPVQTGDMLLSCDELYVNHDLPADSFVVLDGYKMQVCISGRIPLLPLRPLLDDTRLAIAMLSEDDLDGNLKLHLLNRLRGLGYNLLPTTNFNSVFSAAYMTDSSTLVSQPCWPRSRCRGCKWERLH
eukprot:GHVR01069564.1.p1 GENE.GHVR01069564.1~~GHVR01069564.1.p1  ORF type:complete len:523 (+),score=48.41 GHVR01069564.1:707-2275(+)